jgi:membrane protease YdiL (CAAX protease family)
MESPGELETDAHHCTHCQLLIADEARYCHHCGGIQSTHDIDDALQKQQKLVSVAIFFGVHLVICLISNFTAYPRGLVPLLVIDGVLSLFTLLYVVLLWPELKELFRWRGFSLVKSAGYITAAVLGAVLVNFAVKWLNKTIFDAESYYYYAFSHLKYAKLITILVVALQPAIFEELAFRGVLQEGLNKITDKKQAIFISAFLFTILHMSFISFFWLLPFALCLGYVRMKEETIWYGVLIHFCFNTTACFLEFFELNLF